MIWHAVNKKRFSKRRITAASVLGCILKQICYALQLLHVPRIMVTQVMLTGRYLTLLLAEVNRTTQAYAHASGIGSHRHKRPLTSQNFICNEKEKRYKQYDVSARRAFRWASEQKFCEAEASRKF